ncbi:hypothetical protein FACS1894105_10440 [Clostridia bacterium]|nr:hypothetical protein FACS1894105_10440 [Clostridia bacterium]
MNFQISAEKFRQRLAGLENPEQTFSNEQLEEMHKDAQNLILALREVFGDKLDRKTLWDRITHGIEVSSSKSGGKVDKFIAELLDYVKAEPNSVVRSESLGSFIKKSASFSQEYQRQFIRTCVIYRMLLVISAREAATHKTIETEEAE